MVKRVNLTDTAGNPVTLWTNDQGMLISTPHICLNCQHWNKIGEFRSEAQLGSCEKIIDSGPEGDRALAFLSDPGALFAKPLFGCKLWTKLEV